VAQVQVARAAQEDLDRLIRGLILPADTRQRVARALRPLATFPLLGPELQGRWAGFRFLLGPWRWLIMVYVVMDGGERVVVVTFQDARTADSPTA
jgi:plasmid stabilization system protein ParE